MAGRSCCHVERGIAVPVLWSNIVISQVERNTGNDSLAKPYSTDRATLPSPKQFLVFRAYQADF